MINHGFKIGQGEDDDSRDLKDQKVPGWVAKWVRVSSCYAKIAVLSLSLSLSHPFFLSKNHEIKNLKKIRRM